MTINAYPTLVANPITLEAGEDYSFSQLFTVSPAVGDDTYIAWAGVWVWPSNQYSLTGGSPIGVDGVLGWTIEGDPNSIFGVDYGGIDFSSGGIQVASYATGTIEIDFSINIGYYAGPGTQNPYVELGIVGGGGLLFNIAGALFTSGTDTVNFNNLTSAQQAAIAAGADLYNGLGGSDVVTLPSVANYNESLGSAGGTLNWDSSSTFSTGSLAGDTYSVRGSDGSYNIALGAGSDRVTIDGNGSSTISAGSGSATIAISGTGDDTFSGDLNGSASISGGGTLDITGNLNGSASIGADSTLELGGTASGLKVNDTAKLDVDSGGIAISMTVNDGGFLYVSSGGSVSGTVINSGGFVYVESGGTDIGAILSGGEEIDQNGGNDTSTTIDSGGTDIVQSGGTAVDTTVNGGGYLNVLSGGTVDLTVNGGEDVATVELDAGANVTGPITFTGKDDLLQIDGKTMPTAVISGFVAGDTIDLRGVGFTSSSTVALDQNNELHVSAGGQSYPLQFDPNQDFSGQSFYLSSDGHGGTDVEVGQYKLVFAFKQSNSNGLIQQGNLTATLYFNGKLIGKSIEYQASCDDAFPLKNTGGVPITLNSPALNSPEGLGLAFNLSPLAAGGSKQTGVELHGGTVPYNGKLPNVPNQYSWDSQSCLVVSPFHFLTPLEQRLYALDTGTNLTGPLSDDQIDTLAAWIDKNVTVQIGTTINLPQPTLSIKENGNSITKLPNGSFSQGSFQFHISRPIEKEVKVLYKVTDNSASFTGTALINPKFAVSQPIRFASLFSSALPYKPGDAYTIAITGYQVQYHAAAWYEDTGSLATEFLMGKNQTASFNAPLNVATGQTTNSIVVATNAVVNVLAGGTVVDTTVQGLLNVAAGGIDDPTTIDSGGTEIVHRGGSDLGALISGGEQEVFGYASSATVFAGAQIVESGGSATDTTVSSGGMLELLGGAKAGGFTLNSGATLEIASGYVLGGAELPSDVTLAIAGGGTEVVSSGGTASNTVVSSGGTVNVLSGDTTFESATVFGGGRLNVLKGGTADFIAVSSGGALNVAGTITSDVAIFSGGVETVSSGSVVSGTFGSGTAISGGTVNVLSRGAFSFADVDSGGKLSVSKGGTAHNISVSSGGALNVAGTITNDVAIFAGGLETVSSGGLVTGSTGAGTAVSGGTMNVLSGGTAEYLTVFSGGTINISSGGTVDLQTVSSGGTETILHGGTDEDFEVANGGTLVVFGTANTASGVSFVDSGGLEIISSGGTATGGVVVSGILAGTAVGGTVDVLSGGSFSFSIDFGGTTNISAHGTGHDLGAIGGGTLNVLGTVTSDLWAFSGGVINVSSGGVVTGASDTSTMISGGEVDVLSGGKLAFATVSSGGSLNVSSGGRVANIIVSSGGNLNVAGTTISNVTVSSGGMETVSSGGIASGTTIAGGTVEITSGGSDGGKVTFAANSGTLLLDSTTFSGTVAGMAGQDTIDLRNFGLGTVNVTSSITATSATLTVSAGADIAHIILLGNYMASTFTASNDGFGGTSIVDPHVSASQTVSLAQTHSG
jgi:autotransporter passenger strand-loop-strand repeat protein